MNDDDADTLALANVPEPAFFPVVENFPAVAPIGIYAAQHVHERGFPRTVLTDERVDLPGTHGDVDLIKRAHAPRENLLDILHFQQYVRHSFTS